MWWRIFVPTWRFFDQLGAVPQLYVRAVARAGTATGQADSGHPLSSAISDSGRWQLVSDKFRGSWLSLFYNPDGNLTHARNNLYERLLIESQSVEDPRQLVSFQLAEQIAREHILKQNWTRAGSQFQFKLVSGGEDVLVSEMSRL